MQGIVQAPVYAAEKGSAYTTQVKNPAISRYSGAVTVWSGSDEERLLDFCITPRSRGEIAEFFGNTQYYVVKTYIAPLVAKGYLRLTLPETPKSKKQRYVTI
jgi:hypothetical protein